MDFLLQIVRFFVSSTRIRVLFISVSFSLFIIFSLFDFCSIFTRFVFDFLCLKYFCVGYTFSSATVINVSRRNAQFPCFSLGLEGGGELQHLGKRRLVFVHANSQAMKVLDPLVK